MLLLFLARDLTFFNDDWAFIDARQDWTISSFMAPHNGHWSLMVALVWKPLLEIVGLRSYLPYTALLLIAHLLAAAGVYRTCSRLAGPWLGLGAAVLLLFAGYASEVFYLAFTVNLVGATAAGIWAVAFFLDNQSTRTLAVGAALLVVAVATSGAGLFFVAAIAVSSVVYPARRRQIWIVIPALVAYGAWLLLFGTSSFEGVGGASPVGVIEFMVVGIAAAFGANLGLSSGLAQSLGTGGVLIAAFAALAAALLGLVAAIDLVHRRSVPIAVSIALFGMLAEYMIIGLARSGQFGVANALSPRYAYMGSTLLLVGIAGWLGPRLKALSLTGRRVRWVRMAAVVLVAFVVIDVIRLAGGSQTWLARANDTRAVVSVFLQFGGTPAVPADRSAPPLDDDPFVTAVPPPARLDPLVARFGSPLANGTTDPRVPAATQERIRSAIFAASGQAQ